MTAGIGHNSGGDASAHPDVLNQAAQNQLRSIIERVERLEVEKSEVADQIKEVKAEAKGNGFDVKIINKVLAIRKQDRAKRMEEEAILDLYLVAIGEAETFVPARTVQATPAPAPVAAEDDDEFA